MSYINKWFHFYSTTESFEVHRKQGLINPDSICFLKETGQIYTQNSFYGICRERFDNLEKLVLEHDAKIKDILGIDGPSTKDGVINNITDIINFLDGFTDEDNLKDILEKITYAISEQIEEVNKDLLSKIENINNDISSINSQLSTIDIRLNGHDTQISSLITDLGAHIREYNLLKSSYEKFKAYVEDRLDAIDSSISSINSSLKNLQREFTELDEKFDSVEDEVARVQDLLEEAKRLVKGLEDRFGETLAELEEFKRSINGDIKDFEALIGAPKGIAPLDEDAKVPAVYLPSYVDDVLEYPTKAAFPITGETGKIYVALDTNLQYRWSGTQYTELSKSLGLGETAATAYPGNKGKKNADDIADHKSDYNNPHKVTKTQVGLSNVDNTSDMDKPLSTAMIEALADKVSIEPGKGLVSLEDAEKIQEFNSRVGELEGAINSEIDRATKAESAVANELSKHKLDNTNPHGVTKAQVGLGNVDNTSDMNKPISTAQATAIDAKVDKVTGKGLSTNDFTDTYKDFIDNFSAITDAELDEILV